MFGIFFAGCYNIDNKNKKYMTMAKTGSIGVTTENIFPVIKKFQIGRASCRERV